MSTHTHNENPAELAAFCPLCDARFSTKRTKQIAKDKETELFYGTCSRCDQHVLSLVMTQEQGMSSVGLVTDLSEHDVTRLQDAKPLTADDVVAAHRWIGAFKLDQSMIEKIPAEAVRIGLKETRKRMVGRTSRGVKKQKLGKKR